MQAPPAAAAAAAASAGVASTSTARPTGPVYANGRYTALEALGSGAFGSVELVQDAKTKKLLAMKRLKRRNINKYLEAELVNHSLLRHPHIVQFREVFLTDDSVCFVMEYANGGSLFDLVRTQKRLRETQSRWFFQQLILAIDYCHRRGVANRDIKLENCLLHNEEGLPHPLLKLCDFGYSKADFRSAAKTQVGTLSYMAPEVVKSHGCLYDAKLADLWSAGVVLYIMLFGKYPFDLDDDLDIPDSQRSAMMLERMDHERYPLPPSVVLSNECMDIVRRLLKPDPAQRISLEEVLCHPWFVKKLPPHATEMNDYYLTLALPADYQRPDEIKELLAQARQESMDRDAINDARQRAY